MTEVLSEHVVEEVRQIVRVGGTWTPHAERRLREALRLLQREAVTDYRRRTRQLVLRWVEAHEGERVRHREIADELHLARETVTRALGILRREGVVEGDREAGYRITQHQGAA